MEKFHVKLSMISGKSISLPNMYRSDLDTSMRLQRSNVSMPTPTDTKDSKKQNQKELQPNEKKSSNVKSQNKKQKAKDYQLSHRKQIQKLQNSHLKTKIPKENSSYQSQHVKTTATNAKNAREEAVKCSCQENKMEEWHTERMYPELTKDVVDSVNEWSPPPHNRSAYKSCGEYSATTRGANVTGNFSAREAGGAARLYLAMQENDYGRKCAEQPRADVHHINKEMLSEATEKYASIKEERNPDLYKKSQIPSLFENIQAVDRNARTRQYQRLWAAQPPPCEQDRRSAYLARRSIRQKMTEQPKTVLSSKKLYLPNEYKVPSCKTRMKLRSHVNNTLRRYKLPWHGLYHDVKEEDIKHSITRVFD